MTSIGDQRFLRSSRPLPFLAVQKKEIEVLLIFRAPFRLTARRSLLPILARSARPREPFPGNVRNTPVAGWTSARRVVRRVPASS